MRTALTPRSLRASVVLGLALALSLALGAAPAALADDDYIGIFADAAATTTCAALPALQATTLYLYAFPGGGTAAGITGAEFRVVVTQPAGYLFAYTPPAEANLVFGDPMDTVLGEQPQTGVNVAYGACHTETRVSMGTIQVINLGTGGATELRVQRRDPPTNPHIGNCPLLTRCAPFFEAICNRACAVDESGAAIASRVRLNTPGCAEQACPAACTTAPCVTVTAPSLPPRCVGQQTTATATATNCGKAPAQIDVFVEHVLAGSFADVMPGQSVVASRTFTLVNCLGHVEVAAVASVATCSGPAGMEIAKSSQCSSCAPNQPPDCGNAFATRTTLWPADGTLVPVEIGGVTDPDGDPVGYELQFIAADESAGILGTPACPDGFIDGPTSVRLRAERDLAGDGRVYRIKIRGSDGLGGECNTTLDVCVPRKLEVPCASASLRYFATLCDAPPLGNRPPVFSARPLGAGSVEVSLQDASDAEATIEAFDVRGRRVAVVTRARFGPGRHVLRWDGNDESGRAAAAGVYFIRFHSQDGDLTTKTLLVR